MPTIPSLALFFLLCLLSNTPCFFVVVLLCSSSTILFSTCVNLLCFVYLFWFQFGLLNAVALFTSKYRFSTVLYLYLFCFGFSTILTWQQRFIFFVWSEFSYDGWEYFEVVLEKGVVVVVIVDERWCLHEAANLTFLPLVRLKEMIKFSEKFISTFCFFSWNLEHLTFLER